MKAVLIFDNINDLIFYKWDDTFIQRLKQLDDQRVISHSDCTQQLTDSQNVSQLLSPIITSQRVMSAQFSNTYTSMQCKENTNIVFDEWLDHVLMIISEDEVDDSHRELLDCKTLIQHICGQNIKLLRTPLYQTWLSTLLESRTKGDSIPGGSGVIGESGATAAALNALKGAAKEVKCGYPHYHLMLFVGDKMLALYSSRGSDDLTPADIILLSIQCVAAQEYWNSCSSDGVDSQNSRIPWLSHENSGLVYLCGEAGGAPSVPHSLHMSALAPRLVFALLLDVNMRDLGVSTHTSSQLLANVRKLLLQGNLEALPTTLDSLDSAAKKMVESLRKDKNNASICSRLSKSMADLTKSCTTTAPLAAETAASSLHGAIESVLEQLRPDIPALSLDPALRELKTVMAPYVDFLRIKAMRYFSMTSGTDSGSLTEHKYTEDFPGLVHFYYVDRTTGRFLAPDVADCVDILSVDKVQNIISRCFSLIREGYTAASWRLGPVNVSYILWFDKHETPMKPKVLHPAQVRALTTPGDITGAFYRQLTELAFPSATQNISVKELICIHLGLVPTATAVDQARRLACTVRDMTNMRDEQHLLYMQKVLQSGKALLDSCAPSNKPKTPLEPEVYSKGKWTEPICRDLI